jgi:hypothetical protein
MIGRLTNCINKYSSEDRNDEEIYIDIAIDPEIYRKLESIVSCKQNCRVEVIQLRFLNTAKVNLAAGKINRDESTGNY